MAMTTFVVAAGTGLAWLAALVVVTWLVLAGRDPIPGAEPEALPRRRPAPVPAPVWRPQALAFPPSQPGPRMGWSETGWWSTDQDRPGRDDALGSAA